MQDKLSVCIAILSQGDKAGLQTTLNSVFRQTGSPELQIVLVECAVPGCEEDTLHQLTDGGLPENISSFRVCKYDNGDALWRAVRVCTQSQAKFSALLREGDYWLDDGFLCKHFAALSDDFNSAASISTALERNASGQWQPDAVPAAVREGRTRLTGHDLVRDVFPASAGMSVIRTAALRTLPEELFEGPGDVWLLHVLLAYGADVRLIPEPLTVRAESEKGEESARRRFESAGRLDRLTRGFFAEAVVQAQHGFCEEILRTEGPHAPLRHAKLVVYDDAFPHPATGFRMEEFGTLLRELDDVCIVCTGAAMGLFGAADPETVRADYLRAHPEWIGRVCSARALPLELLSADAAYFCFLGNVLPALPWLEKQEIPFSFELYPGGRFELNSPIVDAQLRSVFLSACFYRVITTQRITREYLLQKGMCAQEHISDVFGVVTPREKLQPYRWKKQRYGFEKQTLDIVFTAFRYSAKGEDKGYDVFVETAKLLHRQYADVRFHVVGGFDASVLDVSELGETITFYGCRPSDWFDTFYQDKDLILAPNAVGRVGAGSFDGFPTASCTEAALCGTAILCTDPLELNDGHFDAQSEICILPRDAGVIAQRIAQLRENPAALAALGEAGSRAVRRMYGIDRQMGPRISLLKEMLAYASQLSGTVRQANQLQPMRPIRWRVFYQTEETPEYSDDRRVDGSALFLKDEEVYLEFYLPENFCFPELRLSFYSDTCCFCVPLHAECGNMPLEVFAANGVWMDGEYCFAEGEKQLFFRAADGTSLSDRRVQILLRARWRPADEIGMITGRIMQKFESSAAQMLELQEQWEAGKRDLLSRNEALQDQNSCLQERNKALEEENKTQEETNKLLEQENENLEGQRVCLETEVSRLREKVDGYEKMLAIRLYHKLNQMRYGSDRGPHVTNPPKED